MATEKVTQLPVVITSKLTDIIYAVQDGLSVQETVQQIQSLMLNNIVLNFAGNPNGNVAGTTFQLCWDSVDNILYVCTSSGSTSTAVWTAVQTGIVFPLSPNLGGTGVDNDSHTLTLSGNLTMSGSFNPTLIFQSSDIYTFPTGTQTLVGTDGAMFTGDVFLNGNPINPNQAANKAYVDQFASGVIVILVTYAASTTNFNALYVNGAAGIGATLTDNAGTFAAFATDGTTPPLNSRILIKDQTSQLENGIYSLTTNGDGISIPWVLTRESDYDTPAQIKPGTLVPVQNGTVNATTSWIESATVTTVGTDPIIFSQFTFSPSDFLLVTNNLSELTATAATARSNISAAMLGVNNDITSMTGLTGTLKAPTAILDSNANNVVTFSKVASAVNYLDIKNAATAGDPNLTASGSDTDISLDFQSKGAGFYKFRGTSSRAAALNFYENTGNGTDYIQLKAPESITAPISLVLPPTLGAANDLLKVDGSGNLAFISQLLSSNIPALGGSGMSHIGTFTRDTATASGTQAITGVGFQPSLVIAIGGGIGAATSPTNTQSVGFSNGSVNYCIFNRNAANAGQWAWSSFSFIHIFSVAGASQSATLTSFQADGFTLTWTKTGSPTGTATIGYLAFK